MHRIRRIAIATLATPGLLWVGAAAAVMPDDKCEASKLVAAGKYSLCWLKAEAKAVKTGDPPDYSKCGPKLEDKFSAAENKAGAGVCPTQGDAAAIAAIVNSGSAAVAAALTAAIPPGCGDATKNGADRTPAQRVRHVETSAEGDRLEQLLVVYYERQQSDERVERELQQRQREQQR